MKKTYRLLSIILLFTLCLCACSRVESKSSISCLELIKNLTESEIRLPSGTIYSSQAAQGEDGYISPTLLSALFGGGTFSELRNGWLEYSFFLPYSSHPCEFVSIYCDSLNNATDTARLLSKRLNSIKNTKQEQNGMLSQAKVIIIKNYVFLIVSSDSENAVKLLKSLI